MALLIREVWYVLVVADYISDVFLSFHSLRTSFYLLSLSIATPLCLRGFSLARFAA